MAPQKSIWKWNINTTLVELSASHTATRHDLGQFSLGDMIECGRAVRCLAQASDSMESAALLLVDHFYKSLADRNSGLKNCALVRCFKTHRFQELPPRLQAKARTLLVTQNHSGLDEVPCLTLLASAGDLPAWNDPAGSSSHAVIPLESVEVVERAPMIAQLIRQMGLDIGAVMYPDEKLLIEADERAYGVFHIENAVDNPSIPAQDFVHRYGIKSALGFGGLLPSGDLFAMIMFSRISISREIAALFRTVALSVKLALLPFTRGPIFASDARSKEIVNKRTLEDEESRSEIATLKLLIPALEAAALYQTGRLQDVITDLSKQKEDFQRLGTRLSNMLESTTDAVFMLDREWCFTFLNRHAIALLRVEGGLLGKNIWEEFPAAIGRSFWKHYQTAMNEGAPAKFQEHYPEPIDRWFEVQAFPSEQGIAVFFHDITEQRRADAALMQLEKLAAVGRLAASIAHEINNPLESVTNLLYLARTSTEASEIQDYLNTADRELRRVSAVTNQTLRFHKQSSRPTEVTCEELIHGVLSIYHGRIVNSRVQVQERRRAITPVLCFDGEIRQVLNNLVGNAIDAMHPDGGRLLLRSRETTDWKMGRKGMAITVADTGPGMSVHTRAKASVPFFTTKGIGGTGLGLWISREIIGRHDGTLSVRSSQRNGHTGTVVTFFLPFDATRR